MSISDKIVVCSEPNQIYRAMLHPESLSAWWGCTAVIDAQPGGAWVGGWGEGADGLGQQTVIWAQLAALTPNELVSIQIGDTVIAIRIAAHAQGSEITVEQTGYPASSPEEEAQALQSWVDMVHSLKVWIEQEHPYTPPKPAPQPAAPRPAPVPQPAPAAPAPKPVPAPVASPAPRPATPAPAPAPQAVPAGDAPSDPYNAAAAMAGGKYRVLDDGGFGVTDPNAVIKSWSKEQGFGYATHAQLGDVVFDYDGCDFEPAPGDKVLLLVIAKAWNGKPKVKRIACPAKGSKLDK